MDARYAAEGSFRTAGLFAVVLALLLPATASAADSIYWGNEAQRGSGREPGRHRFRLGRRRGFSVRGGDRFSGRQDLLGELVLGDDPAWEPRPHWHAGDPVLGARRQSLRRRDRPRERQDLLGQFRHQHDPRRQPRRLGPRLDPVHRTGRKRPERGGDRPRGRQDLLDQPVLRRGPGREPGRHRAPPRPCSAAARTTRSGSR